MNQNKLAEMNEYFGRKIAACDERRRQLQEECREDEANFEKIRANVYDIFRTVLDVAVKTQKSVGTAGALSEPKQETVELTGSMSAGEATAKAAAIRAFFLKRLEQIPAGWEQSLRKAAENGDAEKEHIERLKLDVIQEIRAEFLRVWGE